MKRAVLILLTCAMLLTAAQGVMAYTYVQDYGMDDYDPQIKQIQQKLVELGYLTGGADGWFGAKTKAGIARFQLVNEMEQTGLCDQVFQEALFAEGAKASPQVLMTLDELKKMMGKPTKIVKYDISEMVVEKDSATVELNNDTVLHADLLGDGVVEVQCIGKGNVKIPFTVLLMAMDDSIEDSMMYEALDAMKQEGTRVVDGKTIEYAEDPDGTQRLIIKPLKSGPAH